MTETTHYIIHTEVVLVEERKEQVYVSGVGETAVFKEESLGWFVWLKGSYEAIHVGPDQPTLKYGDKVKVTIERML